MREPKRVDEVPITVMRNGDRVAEPTRTRTPRRRRRSTRGIDGRERRDSIAAVAFTGCAPTVCAALGRGELALGMTEAQVLAATRTTELAWTVRRSGGVAVLVAARRGRRRRATRWRRWRWCSSRTAASRASPTVSRRDCAR